MPPAFAGPSGRFCPVGVLWCWRPCGRSGVLTSREPPEARNHLASAEPFLPCWAGPLPAPGAQLQLRLGRPTCWGRMEPGCLPPWGCPAAGPRLCLLCGLSGMLGGEWGSLGRLDFFLLGKMSQFRGVMVSLGALARCSFDLCPEGEVTAGPWVGIHIAGAAGSTGKRVWDLSVNGLQNPFA